MDFPIFFLDFFGNRLLIAVIASIHVFISHGLAVGAYPFVTLLEWWGWRKKDDEWDGLAYKITFVLFVVTTSVGALTGVGIWLSTSLIAPFGIGSLLRVFFWAWFVEWFVFVIEVILIVVYFVTWKRMKEGARKKIHIGIGVILSGFSWITMVIITAILGFMMGSGGWPESRSLFSAIANPLYIPQLAFRTGYAMIIAGLLAWLLIFLFTGRKADIRRRAVRFVSTWVLAWVPLLVAGSIWYWNKAPEAMRANIDVALVTQRFAQWHETLALIMAAAVAAIVVVALVGVIRPKMIPGIALLIPYVLGIWLLGHFERVREFIRKPYIIADYMYSNGVTLSELPVFQRDGILPYATYVPSRSVTKGNMVKAGRDVFLLTCTRCHTTTGINGIVSKFNNLYGEESWDTDAMTAFIHTMHISRTFMPPFPGNDREAEALVAYLNSLRSKPELIVDAHSGWGERASGGALSTSNPDEGGP
jgi:cytochrome c2